MPKQVAGLDQSEAEDLGQCARPARAPRRALDIVAEEKSSEYVVWRIDERLAVALQMGEDFLVDLDRSRCHTGLSSLYSLASRAQSLEGWME
jgi:hypothetical protein